MNTNNSAERKQANLVVGVEAISKGDQLDQLQDLKELLDAGYQALGGADPDLAVVEITAEGFEGHPRARLLAVAKDGWLLRRANQSVWGAWILSKQDDNGNEVIVEVDASLRKMIRFILG
jgi:hypothetical protein